MDETTAAGELSPPPFSLPKEDIFAPIAREVTTFARHLSDAKAAVEEEARLRQTAESLWTPDRLKEHVKTKLQGKPLVVVSKPGTLHARSPRAESGLHCSCGGIGDGVGAGPAGVRGTWIAHGAGDADWEMVDAKDRLRVPPQDPQYTLRRVALTKEEENGYY
jgi:hypothetical protein